MFSKKEKRFEIKTKENMSDMTVYIIVDKHTGVHYMNTSGLAISGLTPLLDQDGKIIIEKSVN